MCEMTTTRDNFDPSVSLLADCNSSSRDEAVEIAYTHNVGEELNEVETTKMAS